MFMRVQQIRLGTLKLIVSEDRDEWFDQRRRKRVSLAFPALARFDPDQITTFALANTSIVRAFSVKVPRCSMSIVDRFRSEYPARLVPDSWYFIASAKDRATTRVVFVSLLTPGLNFAKACVRLVPLLFFDRGVHTRILRRDNGKRIDYRVTIFILLSLIHYSASLPSNDIKHTYRCWPRRMSQSILATDRRLAIRLLAQISKFAYLCFSHFFFSFLFSDKYPFNEILVYP